MRPKLGEILMNLGYATGEEVGRALQIQQAGDEWRRFGEIICELSVKESELLKALSVQFDIPLMSDDQLPEVLPIEKVSFDFLKENVILPFSISNNTLSVAYSDPTDTDALETLRASFDYEIDPYLAKPSTIHEHIEKLHASKDAVMQRLLEGVTDDGTTTEAVGEISHLKDLAQEKGIIQLVNIIIENAIKENSSDVHVEPEETAVRVRYRIDGVLYNKETLPLKTQAALTSRIKLLSQMNIAERRLPQDGRIKGRFSGREVDIRVSTLPTVYGESVVMRILDKEVAFISLEGLGFSHELLDKYGALIKEPYGMILITGPTGSGKTTTLYASLDSINSPDKKIITVEEPVEYLLRGINQIQVRPKIGLTFANGLRSIVRQDPDIIMVGEIRDIETAGISIHAALTGHLLFSTLHTNDAPSAVTRLVDMGAENYLVSSTLIGVIAQRLVRKVCQHCKEPVPMPEEIKLQIGTDTPHIWKGKGCSHCMDTGYRGRIAIFEWQRRPPGISRRRPCHSA
jgi:type II secretory ATPase GspE/PulE/Tfp pilus assembly ATPase PilB-like protein